MLGQTPFCYHNLTIGYNLQIWKMNWTQWQPQESVLNSVKDVLQEALIPDTEVQKNVQEKLSIIQNIPDITYYFLSILGNRAFPEDVRNLSGVLLKNNIAKTYQMLPHESVLKIKEECQSLLMDPSRNIRLSASNVIVILARNHLKTWPDLISFLLKLFAEQNQFSEIALKTLSKICEDLINNRKTQEEVYGIINEVFPTIMEYLGKENCTMYQEIVKLSNQFLQDYFRLMQNSVDLTLYLKNIIRLANTSDTELQKYVCHTFVIYVSKQEESLLPHLHDVIVYLMGKSTHEDNDVALQACEFWLATSKLPKCKEILSPYISKLLPILLKNMRYSERELYLMKDSLGSDAHKKDLAQDITPFHMKSKTNQDDDEFFSDEEVGNHDDDFDDFYMGWTLRKCSASSLDALAVCFGEDILPILLPLISEMLNHSDYLVKESAILALGAISEGCSDGLKSYLPELVTFLQSLMNDCHSGVRVITCWALSRYASWIVNVKPDSPQMYFVPIMLLLLKHSVDDNKSVQRAAISAFCVFQEEAQLKLVPYIGVIIEGFLMGFERYQCRSLYLLYDAIGVLGKSVGSHLSEQQYVSKLLPPLIKKFTESDNYYDDHYVAVLECLANIIPFLEVSFLPYAEVVFCHCLQLINDTLISYLNYQENPDEYDPPDKDPMSVAHDVLYTMAGALKSHFVKFVSNSNLVFLLLTTIQDSSSSIRQTAIALYGELVTLCYPLLSSTINSYIPLIINNLDEHNDAVCQNAAWAIGKLCTVMGASIQPYVPQILEHFVHIIRDPAVARTMHQTVVVSLCTVFFVCPDVKISDISGIVKNCCTMIRFLRDCEEKDLAFRGLCAIMMRNPSFDKNSFMYFCDAAGSWFNIRPDLNDAIKTILMTFKQQCSDETWATFSEQFPDNLKAKLHDLYGV